MAEEMLTMDDLSAEIDSSFSTFKDVDAEGWDKCQQYLEDKTVVTVTVDGIPPKGGVVATLEGLRGFIPASQLSLKYVEDLEGYLGKELKVHVIEVNETDKKLILSAKSVMKIQADLDRAAKINAIQVGSIVEGTVDTLKPYGAFIKIDNDVTGLVHVSQICKKRIQDPANVLKKGQSVQAKVISVKDGKLSLSMRALEEAADAAREEEEKNIKLPESEAIGSNLGALLKGIKLG